MMYVGSMICYYTTCFNHRSRTYWHSGKQCGNNHVTMKTMQLQEMEEFGPNTTELNSSCGVNIPTSWPGGPSRTMVTIVSGAETEERTTKNYTAPPV